MLTSSIRSILTLTLWNLWKGPWRGKYRDVFFRQMRYAGQSPLVLKRFLHELLGSLLSFWRAGILDNQPKTS